MVAPAEAVLRFLEGQVSRHRGAAAQFTRGALTFAVSSDDDGLTDYWTLYLTPRGASLEHGAAPLEYTAPLATLYASPTALAAVTRGEEAADLSADGDRTVLRAVAACLGDSMDLIGARAWR